MSDEMVEVTPEVQMFLGNHFLADMNGGSGQSDDESLSTPQLRLKKTSNLLKLADVNESNSNDGRGSLNGKDDITAALAGASGMMMPGSSERQYLCRLCGRTAPNGASLFAHFLYPHYAHLWRTEIPHRANQYVCKQCPYTTTKRQHFVMHVARVHEDLRKKLTALSENLEVLDNLNPKNINGSTDRIASKVAKFKSSDETTYDDNLALSASEYSNVNSPTAPNDSSMDCGTATPTHVATPSSLAHNGSKETLQLISTAAAATKPKLEPSSFGLIPGRFPRGYKPFVKCRLCGKGWKGKDNFFTHLVSTHFKYMWQAEVPKHADMFHCHVGTCTYQSKYRYNFLFHLAGKHKQLKEKLAKDGIPLDVLVPIETDEVDEEMLAGGSPTLLKTQSAALHQHLIANASSMAMTKFLAATAPPPHSGGGGRTPSHGKYSAANSTVRLICRVCKKMSFNHTCHRQHVVGKHFQEFWAHHTPDQTGVFHCHHPGCTYKTPNRSVFVIHLAYVHSELKSKLIESGRDPNCATPDVYGKRKYRRSHYDNTQHLADPANAASGNSSPTDPLETSDNSVMPPPFVVAASHERQKYVCRLCKTEFNKQKSIVEHLAVAHFNHVWDDSSPENGSFFVPADGPYVCPHCPFNSTTRAPYIAHIVNQHEALKSVMSLQYGDKTIEDLYTIGTTGNDDETYDEGDDDEDDIDDDEENAVDDEDMEDMDDEMDGHMSDIDYNGSKLNESITQAAAATAAEASSW
jgi:hypothetical protein